jgi:hypothetical protein
MKLKLSAYSQERDALLRQIVKTLEKDSRLVAAWLFGSLGRGDADKLSDIDLWLVVADEAIKVITAQRRHFVSQVASPLLVVEAPQNAPKDGAYLMAFYAGPTAPHQVDWYWQPQSQASIPSETSLLFDHVGLDRDSKPVEFTDGEPNKELVEGPSHDVSFFWAMLLITAKYVMRAPWSDKMSLLPVLLKPYHQTQHFLNRDIAFADDGQKFNSPGDKVQILRRLADDMKGMMRDINTQGYGMPMAFVPGAYRYLDLIEAAIQEQEDSPADSLI